MVVAVKAHSHELLLMHSAAVEEFDAENERFFQITASHPSAACIKRTLCEWAFSHLD